jgi:hypothetical protein
MKNNDIRTQVINEVKNGIDRVGKSQVDRDANPQENDNLLQKLWDARVVIGVALLALIIRGCYFFSTDAAPAQLVSTYEIQNDTEDFVGENVTIRSEPVQQVGLSSFTVGNNQLLRDDEPIVVINASGEPFDLPRNRDIKVQVTGEVRELNIPVVERDYGLDLEEEYFVDYVDKPAVIARRILLAPTPSQITRNPARFTGRQLAVRAKVEDIQSPVLFTLDEDELIGGGDLLVFLTSPPKDTIKQGETVMVVGQVRPFVVRDIERDYNITWDLRVRRQLEAEFANKPIFIADAIYE